MSLQGNKPNNKKSSHVRVKEVPGLQSGQQQRKLSDQRQGGSTVSRHSTASSRQKGSSVSRNGRSTTGTSTTGTSSSGRSTTGTTGTSRSEQNSRKSHRKDSTSRMSDSSMDVDDDDDDDDDDSSSDEEAAKSAKSKYQTSAAKLAHEVTPEGQKIARLEAELRREREMVEQKDSQLRKKARRYESDIMELEEKLELAKEEIEKLRSRNAGLVSALNAVGKDEPRVRRQEMVKQVEKVVVTKVFPANPFVETKEGLVKITAGIKESFDFEDEDEEDGFVTAYCCVVRSKINQLRSYAVKGLKDAAMLGE